MENTMYVWNTEEVLKDKNFIDVCNKHDVRSVFLSINDFQPEKYLEFLANDLNFYAMASTNEFVVKHRYAFEYIMKIIKFNKLLPDSFKGVHFDIEPHAFNDWETRKREYLENLFEVVKESNNISQNNSLEFGLSIPYWYKYDRLTFNGDNKPIAYHLIDNSNHVSIMAYKKTVPEITDCVNEEILYGGRKIIVAVDNLILLDEVKEMLQEKYSSSFKGVAIHHYKKLIDGF